MRSFNISLNASFLLIISLLSLLIVFKFNGTGLEADSYHHHLIAKYAFRHPQLFFDHWGKPLYTLISSPFAQFGFLGSKLFNVSLSILNAFLIVKLLRSFRVDLAPWGILFFFLIPLNFQTNFSAFTEPLFATFLLLAIVLCRKRHFLAAAILISFGPLIRSEGLVILILFAFYFILRKQYHFLIFLLAGQLLYAFLGFLLMDYHPLWIFRDIPYASLDSPYGRGKAFHFAEQLFYMLGPILLVLFLLGLAMSLHRKALKDIDYSVLILGSFLAFFFFHSFSWYFGWFNSMGLKRVFGAVTPLFTIITLYGIHTIMTALPYKLRTIIISLLLAITALLLFSKGPAGIDWKKEMNLSPAQEIALKCAEYVKDSPMANARMLFADTYLAEGLHLDIFESKDFKWLSLEHLKELNTNELIIWDNWHAVTDFGVELNKLDSNPQLEKIKEFIDDKHSRKVHYVIYKVN